MTKRVTPGEPILPHITAKWFNDTLRQPTQPPSPRKEDGRHHNETKATFVPTDDCAKALRFTAVAPIGRVDTYGNRVQRAQFVDKGSLNKYNWIITQLEMSAGNLTQECVYSGITYARVNILNPNHKYVDLNLDTLELESSNSGKGILLDVGSEYSLISIETFVGTAATRTTTTQPLTPVEPQCDGECKHTATAELTWVLAENNCAAPTTSTTSTTTTTSGAGTTTTYDGYSRCVGTSSTTTTPDECDCLFPSFCPTNPTDVTFTACSTGRNSEPPCSSTTTSTTTSCDCNTTTTGEGGCNCGFIEVARPDGGIDVVQIGFCPDPCNCVPGLEPGDPCDPDCDARLTGRCVCPPPPPECPTCEGTTYLTCLPGCDGNLYWQGVTSCYNADILCRRSDGTYCAPVYSTAPCQNCGEFLITGCQLVPYNTSTTPDIEPNCCTGPCADCYGCPSTTTSSTSTTTTNDCTLPCTRKWDGAVWNVTSSNCNSPCACGGVPYDGRVVNEVVQVPCFTPTSTTTTSTSTTTTPNKGACCSDLVSPGECFGNLTAAQCSADYSGVFLGVGTVCDPNPCNTTTTTTTTTTSTSTNTSTSTSTSTTTTAAGACCFTVEGCLTAGSEASCIGSGGTWQGLGSVCDPNPCPTTTTSSDPGSSTEEPTTTTTTTNLGSTSTMGL